MPPSNCRHVGGPQPWVDVRVRQRKRNSGNRMQWGPKARAGLGAEGGCMEAPCSAMQPALVIAACCPNPARSRRRPLSTRPRRRRRLRHRRHLDRGSRGRPSGQHAPACQARCAFHNAALPRHGFGRGAAFRAPPHPAPPALAETSHRCNQVEQPKSERAVPIKQRENDCGAAVLSSRIMRAGRRAARKHGLKGRAGPRARVSRCRSRRSPLTRAAPGSQRPP